MKREREWRRLGIVTGLGTLAWLYLTACASVPLSANDRLVLVTIENARSQDMIDPRFYILGSGRVSLGIVPDLGTRVMLVDSRYFAADGCFSVVAHFVGEGDWVSDRVCWREGEEVDVKLMSLLSTSSAWSHRPIQ